MNDHMTELFNANPVGFAAFRKKVPEIPLKLVKEFYARQALPELNAVPRVRHRFRITAPNDSYQVDITHMPYRSRGFDKFFTAVEITTRVAHVFPIKNMNAPTIVEAMAKLRDAATVKLVEADNQFAAKAVADFCVNNGIELVTLVADDEHITKGANKLGIIDAFTRTLKRRIRNYLIQHSSQDFITPLAGIVEDYNNTVHSRLGASPNAIAADPDKMASIQVNAMNHNRQQAADSAIPDGTKVRRVVRKATFDKEGPRFTRETFNVVGREGFRFKLDDGEKLFKPHELRASKAPGVQSQAVSDRRMRSVIKAVKVARALAKEGIDAGNVVRGTRRKRHAIP